MTAADIAQLAERAPILAAKLRRLTPERLAAIFNPQEPAA